MLTHTITVTNGSHTMTISLRAKKLDENYTLYQKCYNFNPNSESTALTEMDYWSRVEQRLARHARYDGYKPVCSAGMKVVTWA